MKIEKLESLRGFAALYVVLHHTLPHHYIWGSVNIGIFFRFGQEAVILFFLLSGFVINYSYQRSRDKSFRTFFLKRFSRIYFPLLLIMLLGYSIESLRNASLVDPDLKTLMLNLLMLQDVGVLKPNVIVEPYMHNSPLWSLSYEWWFYMLFFPIQRFISSERYQDTLLFSLSIGAALAYQFYPYFIPRLLMYMSIWWTGVFLSNRYISGTKMNILELKIPIFCLSVICLVLSLQVYFQGITWENIRFGVHPVLEIRHHGFALLAIILAVIWSNLKWVGFNYTFSSFIYFAPVSYVMYISHIFLVTNVNYLSFCNNRVLEWFGYIFILLLFSWLVEGVFYPKLQRKFLDMTVSSKNMV